MTRFTLLLARGFTLAIACSAADANAMGVSARLELVAENQTTNPFFYEGAYDVYHLVADNTFGQDISTFNLTLPVNNVINAGAGGDVFSSPTPDLPSLGTLVIPDSFFATNGEDPTFVSLTSTPGTGQDEGLLGYVSAIGGASLLDAGATDQVLAVFSVEAGAPAPSVANFSGEAAVPVFGDLPQSGIIPGDIDSDGDVDLIDLDTLAPIFPAPPFSPFDVNGDGVGDIVDYTIQSANFGLTTATATTVALDAVSLTIDFLPAVPHVCGDTDGDGDVDLIDLDTIGVNFGVTNAIGGASIGDFNGDGRVDLIDLDKAGHFFGTGTTSAIPEPSTTALLATGLLARSRPRQQEAQR